MTHPIELAIQLAEKYQLVKQTAMTNEIILPLFELQQTRVNDVKRIKEIMYQNQKRDDRLDGLYMLLDAQEQILTSPDAVQVQKALQTIESINDIIRATLCPPAHPHFWITPHSLETTHEVKGEKQVYRSTYSVCVSCKNIIVTL